MPTNAAAVPAIVTRKEVERLFLNKGAESAIHEAAQRAARLRPRGFDLTSSWTSWRGAVSV